MPPRVEMTNCELTVSTANPTNGFEIPILRDVNDDISSLVIQSTFVDAVPIHSVLGRLNQSIRSHGDVEVLLSVRSELEWESQEWW